MDNLVSRQSAPRTATDYEAAIEQMLAEMKRLNEQMATDRAEIERLRVETQRLKAETRAVLETLGVAV
jgi:uncharacterized small protein (DUF1192 family)